MNINDFNVFEGRIKGLEDEISHLEGEINKLRVEALQRERDRLKWGVGALGIVVMALGGWAWSQVQDMVHLTIGNSR